VKVGVICPYSLSVPGGVQGQVLGLARALRAVGHDARVLGPTDGPPPEPGITSVGPSVRFESNGSISPMAASRSVAARTLEWLRVFAPDVVHLHEPMVPGPTHAALLGAEAPLVATFHASGGHPAYQRLRRVAVRAAERLTFRVAVSAEARDTAAAALGGSYLLLPNGVDVDAFAKATPLPTDEPVVFFCGRHEPRKGLGVLLDAWERLEGDAVLWVASDGPQTEELHARGTPRVVWLGRITEAEKARRLRSATVFCAPSLGQESFGIVLLEAMAAGTPVVASDIPGYRQVARADHDEALLVPPGDPDLLARALHRLLGDPALRARLAHRGEIRAAEFSLARLAERYLDVYEMAVALRR